MSILNYINIPVFMVSLAIGLFFVYIYNPDKRKIYIYPTPDNVDTVQYKDSTDTCFEFKQTKETKRIIKYFIILNFELFIFESF
jgi:hypothetical protein